MFVGTGSRHEDLESSGTAYLLEKMLLRGTSSHSKSDLWESIENLGGHYQARTGREQSSYALKVFKNDTDTAVKLLGDIICNSKIDG